MKLSIGVDHLTIEPENASEEAHLRYLGFTGVGVQLVAEAGEPGRMSYQSDTTGLAIKIAKGQDIGKKA